MTMTPAKERQYEAAHVAANECFAPGAWAVVPGQVLAPVRHACLVCWHETDPYVPYV
jgi:hypothetical protein